MHNWDFWVSVGDSCKQVVSVLSFTIPYHNPRLSTGEVPAGLVKSKFHYCVQTEHTSNGPEGLFADIIYF